MTAPAHRAPQDVTAARARLDTIIAAVEKARRGAVLAAPQTHIIAVSKTHGPDAIVPLIAAGQRLFGENRVQEAQAKWPALREAHDGLELHLVGALQSNKAKAAVSLFDAIHSLDRVSLADALADAIVKQGRTPRLFVQVNTGEEPQKAGVAPRALDALLAHAAGAGLQVAGLMCVPPVEADPAPHFAWTCDAARERGLPLLSMGMSGDFETAVRFGATHLRIGTALFGARG